MTDVTPNLAGKGLRIGVVWSRFNEELVRQLVTACDRQLVELGVSADDIDVVSVPGALEIPIAIQTLAFERRGLAGRRYDALIALGCVFAARPTTSRSSRTRARAAPSTCSSRPASRS